MTRLAALETIAIFTSIGVGVLTTIVFGALDSQIHAKEAGSVEVFDGISSVSIILKFNKSKA